MPLFATASGRLVIFFCTRMQKSQTQLSFVFLAFFFFAAFPFFCCFCLFAAVAICLLGFQSVEEFFRESIIKKLFLSSGEEGNYPPSFSLGFLNVSVHI